jgi:MFS transporter, DHA1 family, tetracycline resistance protein
MASLVKQPSLFPILLVNFVGTLGFSIVLPFLVFLVMKFGGDAEVETLERWQFLPTSGLF